MDADGYLRMRDEDKPPSAGGPSFSVPVQVGVPNVGNVTVPVAVPVPQGWSDGASLADSTLQQYTRPAPGTFNPHLRGRWFDELFDCFRSCLPCVLATFCPCFLFASNVSRANLLSCVWALGLYFAPVLLIILFGVVFYLTGVYAVVAIPYLVVYIYIASLLGYYRSKLRAKYEIEGICLGDCIIHFFCQCCALSQETRHIDMDMPPVEAADAPHMQIAPGGRAAIAV